MGKGYSDQIKCIGKGFKGAGDEGRFEAPMTGIAGSQPSPFSIVSLTPHLRRGEGEVPAVGWLGTRVGKGES